MDKQASRPSVAKMISKYMFMILNILLLSKKYIFHFVLI